MQVKQLDHLNLSVHDFDETAAWYGRVFGFEVAQDETDGDGVRWGVLRSGDAMLCIYQHPELEFETPDAARRAGRHAIRHFGLRITDREAWLATAEREKLEFAYGGEVQWPHSSAWYVDDPTGYHIEVALWNGDRVAFG